MFFFVNSFYSFNINNIYINIHLGEVECDIQKVNNVFVGFDGDSQAVFF